MVDQTFSRKAIYSCKKASSSAHALFDVPSFDERGRELMIARDDFLT